MKKLLLGIALIGMIGVVSSCVESTVIRGNGRVARGAFDISADYTALEVSNGILVEFLAPVSEGVSGAGAAEGAVLEASAGSVSGTVSGSVSGLVEGVIVADEEVLEHVAIVEEDGVVKVSYEPFVSVRADVKTVVTMPLSRALVRLDAESAGRIVSEVRIVAGELSVECSSAGEVELDIDAERLAVELDSAANFRGNLSVRNLFVEMDSASRCAVDGRADYLEVEADSAANFRGIGLVCGRVDADASSAGDVEVTVTEELNARASSGGAVRYKGGPVVVRRESSSGGVVREI
ncbi:MAG: DUF2807 domain-containing protein [Alistipes sp.]|jgi:hypothetical protein|nr:DUF2807 domain-containing protein [Alistipes sp.]